jgi:hypothetical protein
MSLSSLSGGCIAPSSRQRHRISVATFRISTVKFVLYVAV